MNGQFDASAARRWVVKVGSSLITNVESGINLERIQSWAQQIAELKSDGVEIVLVSSGSIVEGMKRLGWTERPHEVHLLQVAAAVGQMGLVRNYEAEFDKYGYRTAQILLTNADLADRTRYLNVRNTLRSLLEMNVIPIVNENDTVATDDIKFGDNDNLAGLVTNIVDADLLVILTDQQGLFQADPRNDPSASLIERAWSDEEFLDQAVGPSSKYGRGGMTTKLEAARKASRSGAATIIASGLQADQLQKIHANTINGTLLQSRTGRIAAHKQWLAGRLRIAGKVHLDHGAVSALLDQGRSLLPVGVRHVEGKFKRGDLVVCVNTESKEIARGLINYDSDEANNIKGRRTGRIESILGYVRDHELIHRDNMVIML
ncbi:MAG: glutamate 5-kinase [Acidiferrobacterales bacterium]|nr:glutamate 5-kinase [Acidiferrobacterales bacterium]